jgi:hypothetical protein
VEKGREGAVSEVADAMKGRIVQVAAGPFLCR